MVQGQKITRIEALEAALRQAVELFAYKGETWTGYPPADEAWAEAADKWGVSARALLTPPEADDGQSNT